jgi:hypothetical protein
MTSVAKLASSGKAFACGLYKNVPKALIPNIGEDTLRFFWDNFCDPGNDPSLPGLPPPPGPPFQGGQCGDWYRIYITFSRINDNGVEIFDNDLYVGQLLGPIESFIESATSSLGGRWVLARAVYGPTQTSDPNLWGLYNATGINQFKLISTRLERASGAIDNCGNPPADYPPAAPPPADGFTSPPTQIILNDGDQIFVRFNFAPPKLVFPDFKFPDFNMNIFTPRFNIPVTFNFNGDFRFGGGGGGSPPPPPFPPDLIDKINNINNNTDNINNNTNNISNTTNNIDNSVDNFYSDYKKDRDRTINKEPLPDDFEPPKPPEPPGKKLVERLAYVNVDLSIIPSNAKSQSGKGAPNILYAGWFEFLRKDKSFPRNYIHFANNCFIAPVGADGYAFTLYNGYQGTAVAITFKE